MDCIFYSTLPECKKKSTEIVAYEIGNFLEQVGNLIASNPNYPRCFTSPNYKVLTPDGKGNLQGSITVQISSADDVTFINEFRAYANSSGDRSNYVLKLEILMLLCAGGDDKLELAGHEEEYSNVYSCELYYWSSRSSTTICWKTTLEGLKTKLETPYKDALARVEASFTFFENFDSSPSEWETIPSKKPPVNVPYAKLLADGYCADFVIESQGREFPVQSLILKATSPVFARMLETDMMEASSGRIVINDVEPETVEQLLQFTYTGSLKDAQVSEEIMMDLLHCADKYEFMELKIEILMKMRSQLTIENAVKFTKAAKSYRADEETLRSFLLFCRSALPSFHMGSDFKEFLLDNLKALIGPPDGPERLSSFDTSATRLRAKNAHTTFILEIPNFLEQVKLSAAKTRKLMLPPYSVKAPDGMTQLKGSITVQLLYSTIEVCNVFCIELSDKSTLRSLDTKAEIRIELKSSAGEKINTYENYSCLYSPDNVESKLNMSVEQIQQLISQHSDDADKVSAGVVVTISMNAPSGAPQLVPKEVGNHMPCSTHLALKKYTDLTVECDGKEYQAHSLILKSVSPVFAGMLDSETLTVPSSCIKIPDFDCQTLEQMLGFIYNGGFCKGSLTDAMIVRLLKCAHKYEISSLKAEILSRMSATLSIENVIQFVQAVKTHAAGDDGDKVIMHMLEFCKRNLASFPKNDAFKEFLLEHLEVLI